jgi:hypothetical protein
MVNTELQGTWKETSLALFEAPSWHSPEETGRSHKQPRKVMVVVVVVGIMTWYPRNRDRIHYCLSQRALPTESS